MLFSFVVGASICPGAGLEYVPGSGWRSHVWYVLLSYWVYRFMQAALKPAGGAGINVMPLFSRQILSGTGLSVVRQREAFH
jgi:hypothetical protein